MRGEMLKQKHSLSLHVHPTTPAAQADSRLSRCFMVNYEHIFSLRFTKG